jgi:hypothetical protein
MTEVWDGEREQIPGGMAERKAKARATAKANTEVSPLRITETKA